MSSDDAGFFLELSDMLQSRSAAQIRSEAKAYAQLRALFPGKSLPQIVTLVRAWHKKERLSAPVLADRIAMQLDGSSDEPREALLEDLRGLNRSTLTALYKRMGFAPESDVSRARQDLVEYVLSRGDDRPATIEELARRTAVPFIERAKASLKSVDVASAEQLHRVADEVYAIKGTQAKDVFSAFARGLGCDVKGSKAQMRKALRKYIDDLARLHQQSRS